MSPGERCEQIIEMIDEALGEETSAPIERPSMVIAASRQQARSGGAVPDSTTSARVCVFPPFP